MEEDMGAYIGDCIVISCCCQCLIIQVIVVVFINLPIKIGRKLKNYANKKLKRHRMRRKGRSRRDKRSTLAVHCGSDNDKPCSGDVPGEGELLSGLEKGSVRWIQVGGETISLNFTDECNRRGKECMEEVESVLQELSLKGEFAFGSFWRRVTTSDQQLEDEYSFRYERSYIHCDLIQVISTIT